MIAIVSKANGGSLVGALIALLLVFAAGWAFGYLFAYWRRYDAGWRAYRAWYHRALMHMVEKNDADTVDAVLSAFEATIKEELS